MQRDRRTVLRGFGAVGGLLIGGCTADSDREIKIIGLAVTNWSNNPVTVSVKMDLENRDTITRKETIVDAFSEEAEGGNQVLAIERLGKVPLEEIRVQVSFDGGSLNEIPFEIEKQDNTECGVLQIVYHGEDTIENDVEAWECDPYNTTSQNTTARLQR